MAYDFNEVEFQQWEEAIDSTGRTYWYNVHTRYSTWENPYLSQKTATGDELYQTGSIDLQEKTTVVDFSEQGRDRSHSMSTVSDFEQIQLSDFPNEEPRFNIDTDRRHSSSFSSLNGRFVLQQKPNRPLDNSPLDNSKSTRPSSDIWIECKEVVSGRTLFYHRHSLKIAFDVIPLETAAAPATEASSDNLSIVIPPGRKGTRTSISGSGNHQPSSGNHQQSSFSSMKLSDFNSGMPSSYAMMTPDASSQLNCLDIVKELLDTNSMPWNFNNPVAIYYRCCNKIFGTLSELTPSARALLYPCYYSNIPIPQLKLIVFCIKIPDNSINNGISQTKINVNVTDCADDVIAKVLRKCDKKDVESERCLLKALGLEEYIYGSRNVLDFEYVRECLSNHVDIQLSLLYIDDMERTVHEVEDELHADRISTSYPDDIHLTPIYTEQDYEEACSNRLDPVENIRVLPLTQMSIPFKFQICDLENVNVCPRFDQLLYAVCIEVKLMLGTETLPNTTIRTRFRRPREGLLFLQDIVLPSIELSTLPTACLLVFSVFGVRLEQKEVLLAYVKQPLIEHNNCLVSGSRCLPMWILPNDEKDFDNMAMSRATSRPNLSSMDAPILNVRFPMYLVPIMAPPAPYFGFDEYSQTPGSVNSNFSSKIRTKLEQIVAKDLLSGLDKEEREILWMARYNYIKNPDVLPKLLLCVDWMSHQQRSEAYYLIAIWEKPRHPLHALCFLNVHYPDSYVRSYAISILDLLTDSELQQVLLQLVQVLKFEINHDSPLAQFLIRRSIANPYQIGHFFFWHIKAEIHNAEFCERYTLIMESYIVHFKRHARELALQDRMIKQFQAIAEEIAYKKIKELAPDNECKLYLQEALARINEAFPSRLQISLNPKWQVRSLKPALCKFMSSKKVPLWLCFENCDTDAEDLLVIFKTGDDLRQDLLTLQLFRTMDRVWLQEGRDLSLKPYTCVATGVTKNNDGVGMIQVVGKSATISQIQIEEGGGALGAFKNNTLVKWLQKHNRGTNEYMQAADNFLRSCAGYCVATFCLGIGDRHNDNIMLTKDGYLFHIDFGHFLGNFKSKYGFKRERAPFVFTPEMAQVMGGLRSKEYKEFVAQCCSAFNILRKEATLFFTLFNLMIAAGMPELSCAEDIYYLRDRLLLTLNDDAASKTFKKEIKKTVSDFYRRVDNSIHILKHG